MLLWEVVLKHIGPVACVETIPEKHQ